MKSPDILLVSNGFGEMAIVTYIARALRAQSDAARIEHLPLVGRAPSDAWPAAVGPQADMPSGGLIAYWNLRNLAADIGAGLGALTLRQYRFLYQQRQRDVIVAVGDIYCLSLSLLAARRPTLFVATAKSDYVAPHSGIELAIARRATAAFARDEVTAASMRAAGVAASYAGNIMMDGVQRMGIDLSIKPDALVIAVLPGSRADAAAAAAGQVERVAAIAQQMAGRGRKVQALVSIAPSVEATAVRDAIRNVGIDLTAPSPGVGVIASGQRDNLELALVRGAFGDMIAAAAIVLGQAGTANEQAAGCGKPVIAAAQPGEAPERMQWYRMRQKRLLGDALLVLQPKPQAFAAEVVRLIDDPQRIAHMAETGRKRMGSPGGAQAVAQKALSVAMGKART
jgi:uncharacterized protein (TIGR03492 family)